MERPITSHVASVPPRSGCIVCNGGGHRVVSAEVRGG